MLAPPPSPAGDDTALCHYLLHLDLITSDMGESVPIWSFISPMVVDPIVDPMAIVVTMIATIVQALVLVPIMGLVLLLLGDLWTMKSSD